MGRKVALSVMLGLWVAGAQEDRTIVESPDEDELIQEEIGPRLEDLPEAEKLPDWLIDVQPEPSGGEWSGGNVREKRYVEKHYVDEDEHVVSQSRMFSVSGGDALRVGAIANHADELRGQFNSLLKIGGKWKYSISIRLLGHTADAARPFPIRTRVKVLGREPNLQIRVFAGGGVNLAKLDEAIITMLLYEYALREMQPDALPDYLEMPQWVITGMQQAFLWKQGRIDRRFYENLFNKGDMMSPEEILKTKDPSKLDAGSRQLYDVSCGVLMMGLLHREGGVDQLRSLLSEALTQEGDFKQMLATHVHELQLDKNSFSKWWALELAALAAPQAMDMLTPIETEKQLEDALMLSGINQETKLAYAVSVAQVEEMMKIPNWRQQMRRRVDALTELNTRCFPGYRVIIMEYVRAIGEMLKGAELKEVKAILEPLAELRTAYKEASIRGRDYLDWYEITQLGESQRANFGVYREAMRMLRQESPGPDTPMSRYLDDIEALHELKEGEPLPARMRSALPKESVKK